MRSCSKALVGLSATHNLRFYLWYAEVVLGTSFRRKRRAALGINKEKSSEL
jgi:hypothetical protein